jgi:hypothetical protein
MPENLEARRDGANAILSYPYSSSSIDGASAAGGETICHLKRASYFSGPRPPNGAANDLLTWSCQPDQISE